MTPPKELAEWLDDPQPANFPFDPVVGEIRRVGKHFISQELLEELSLAREILSTLDGSDADVIMLDHFLDTVFDKFDNRYGYATHNVHRALAMPGPDDDLSLAPAARRWRDRMLVLLMADLLRFEADAAEGKTGLTLQMPPGHAVLAKRQRLAVRATEPALARLGMRITASRTDPAVAARQLISHADSMMSTPDRRMLQISMLPTFVAHDEYLFIRVLQAYDVTFGMLVQQIRLAIRGLADADAGSVTQAMEFATGVLAESASLFSLLATMPVESFDSFREYTEGASAIQSVNYKLLESLCRVPDRERFDSVAYDATPEVRERILAGQRSLDDAFLAAQRDHRVSARDLARMASSLRQFAGEFLRWKRTHHGLAVRMIGNRCGTDFTEGASYLKKAAATPIFLTIAGTDLHHLSEPH